MQKQRLLLRAQAILRYLEGKDEKVEKLILFTPEDVELTTHDQHLYEAMGSIKDRKKIDYNKLIKFLEVVKITSINRSILTHEKVAEIRKSLEDDLQ